MISLAALKLRPGKCTLFGAYKSRVSHRFSVLSCHSCTPVQIWDPYLSILNIVFIHIARYFDQALQISSVATACWSNTTSRHSEYNFYNYQHPLHTPKYCIIRCPHMYRTICNSLKHSSVSTWNFPNGCFYPSSSWWHAPFPLSTARRPTGTPELPRAGWTGRCENCKSWLQYIYKCTRRIKMH